MTKLKSFQFHADKHGNLCIGAPSRGKTSSAYINALNMFLGTMHLSNEEVGAMMRDILGHLQNRDLEPLKKYSFLDKILKGTPKRPHIPLSVRRNVLSHGRCVACGSTEKLEVDHCIPYSLGGAHEESNFQCLCLVCNRKKSNRI